MLDAAGHLVLIDFGTCKDLWRPDLNGPEFCGTPGFMAPEIASGKYSNKADIYSLTVTFYDMALGRTEACKASIPDMDADDPCAPLRPRDAADASAAKTYELLVFALRARSADRPSAGALLAKIRELMASGAGAAGT